MFADYPDLLLVGAVLLAGWFAHWAGQYAHVPRVTLLILLGALIGPFGFDAVPAEAAVWFPHITHFALAMVGFLLGEKFTGSHIRQSGRTVLLLSLGEALLTACAVFLVLFLIGVSLPLALTLAAVAPTTAPAATLDVVKESGASGSLTDTLVDIVAIDDAWGVLLFSLLLVLTELVVTAKPDWALLGVGLWEIGGAAGLGILLGLPMAFLTGRFKEGEPQLLEAAGFVFICGGIALYLDVSYLLACMFLGGTVAVAGKHHTRPFREIEGIAEPFLVIFFLLAGFELNPAAFRAFGWIGLAYALSRAFGKIAGASVVARFVTTDATIRKHIGWCLLPQAGVAVGLALLVAERNPQLGEVVLPMIVGTTILFEIAGPVLTRRHLKLGGQFKKDEAV